MSDPQRPTLGLVAGKYEVLQLIGRGGMGSVWEGRHNSLGTRVAIKFVDVEHAESHEARTRFVTEARAAATIRSKYAIQIYDHGVTDEGRPYIVMELLVGEPLDRRIERLGRLSLVETARIVAQVCRALQLAHDLGIIHRDLKPENIFIVRPSEDDDEIAKVLDFGIAKIRPAPGEQPLSNSTKTGAVLGTPYYMSPEQARGLREIDHRTDLWSLGVIAYKCVTGALPFQGESVGDLLVKICTGGLPVPSDAVATLPTSFDAWFARALDREPERRFARALDLAEALSLSAGIAVRRGEASGETEISPPAVLPPHPANPLSRGIEDTVDGLTPSEFSGGAVTSAPFTSSATLPRTRRSNVLAAAAAAVIGGSVGVMAVANLLGTRGSSAATERADAKTDHAGKASGEHAGKAPPFRSSPDAVAPLASALREGPSGPGAAREGPSGPGAAREGPSGPGAAREGLSGSAGTRESASGPGATREGPSGSARTASASPTAAIETMGTPPLAGAPLSGPHPVRPALPDSMRGASLPANAPAPSASGRPTLARENENGARVEQKAAPPVADPGY